MLSVCRISVRQATIPMLALAVLLAWTAPARAQGFGVGARIAWVHPDVDADVDALRYYGGQSASCRRVLGSRSPWIIIQRR